MIKYVQHYLHYIRNHLMPNLLDSVNKCRHVIVYNVDPSQALLDIQEFYELTLMDDGKTNEAKASVALEMASRYESLSFDIIVKLVIARC